MPLLPTRVQKDLTWNPLDIAGTITACFGSRSPVHLPRPRAQGNFQLNVFKPVMIFNLLQSMRLLADASESFNVNCAVGIEVRRDTVDRNLRASLMLVTALNQHIGYDKAAKVAKKAFLENKTLRDTVVELGYMDGAAFDAAVRPDRMISPL